RDEIICHPREIDLKYVVNNVVLLLKGMMEDKKITLSQSHDLSHYAIADSRMMGTVVRNLLSNAIKFTPKNGTIQIRSWQEGNQISLEIVDSGVGMDAEQIARLQSGENVTSTAGTENEKGTGLGFRICQDYIQRNNGTILLSSEKGKGTTVHITLPASTQEMTEGTPQPANTAQINIDRSILEGNTILIVDDDPLICNNIKNILSEYVQTLVAKDGREGLQLAETHQPDLILSDVDMPTMNGIEMSKALALSGRTKGVPILFISANNEESDRLTGLLSGAIDYIAKPFSQSELLLKIYNLLNIRKEQQKRLLTELMIKGEHTPEQESEQEEKINPFLKTFLEVVEEKHVESQITIEDLAQAMAVSQPTLNRKIRSLTGKTPLEVLNEYRLNHALRLLQDSSSDDNVADVAYSVGFNDPSYFTKKFRDFFGYLPSQVQNK
ncbi:MAG: response regulator, partial [Paludibacteraceae bacterium]|nr:response regulator [Paludibacteraceae bacterium]